MKTRYDRRYHWVELLERDSHELGSVLRQHGRLNSLEVVSPNAGTPVEAQKVLLIQRLDITIEEEGIAEGLLEEKLG